MAKKTPKVLRPPISQPNRLLKYSNEHIAYEIGMFFNSIQARRARLTPDPRPIVHFFNMARIESFVIHFRALVMFFYPDVYPPKREDVLAHHFLPGPAPSATWIKTRPALSVTLRHAKKRADKEISHLTAGRIAGSRPQKGWDFVALGDEIRNLLKVLVNVSDPARLGANIKATIPSGPL
jgi:hypothetical protein